MTRQVSWWPPDGPIDAIGSTIYVGPDENPELTLLRRIAELAAPYGDQNRELMNALADLQGMKR